MAEKKEQAAAAPAAAEKRVRAAPVEAVEYMALIEIDYPDGLENYKLALAGKVGKAKYLHLKKGDKASDLQPGDIPWMLRERWIKAVKP